MQKVISKVIDKYLIFYIINTIELLGVYAPRIKAEFYAQLFYFMKYMRINLKAPLSFEDQCARLKSHGMIISDLSTAKDFLSKVNYYRFSGYFLQFRKSENQSDLVNGITFEKIVEIYKFDEELRNTSRKYLENIEIFYRTQISYYFSMEKCVCPPHTQHYDINNFYNKTGFSEVINSFNSQKKYYKDSLVLQHHDKVYSGKMPLWVIVEFLSFSNLSKLFNAMYISDKNVIANALGTSGKMLSNNLHCLSVFRNKCAHAARLYNTIFSPPAKFNKSFLRTYKSVSNNSFFAYLLILLKRIPDRETKKDCVQEFTAIIEKYKKTVDISLLGIPVNYKDIFN